MRKLFLILLTLISTNIFAMEHDYEKYISHIQSLSLTANYYPDKQEKLYKEIEQAINLFCLQEDNLFEFCANWKCVQLVDKFYSITNQITEFIAYLDDQDKRLELAEKFAAKVKAAIFHGRLPEPTDEYRFSRQPLSLWQAFCQNSDRCNSYTLLLIYYLCPKDVNQLKRDLPLNVPCFFALAQASLMAYDALSVTLPKIKNINSTDKCAKNFIYYLKYQNVNPPMAQLSLEMLARLLISSGMNKASVSAKVAEFK